MPVTKTKDGRTLLTGKDYTELRLHVYIRDKGFCQRCGIRVRYEQQGFDDDYHLAHVIPRRMGGGSRDDTMENTHVLCAKCHRKEHNQA
jgi:5-methylcytosine-specific restriction endonuclease McrA